jgi:hypothetical protein
MTKIPNPKRVWLGPEGPQLSLGHWKLKFGTSLEFGAWDL